MSLNFFMGLIMVVIIDGASGRYCFQCIAIDCDPNSTVCIDLHQEIESRLRPYYNFGVHLKTCPDVTDLWEWRYLQLDDEECHSPKEHEPTCTIGRMKFTFSDNDNDKSNNVVYGTVMGCATDTLLFRLKDVGEQCDYRTVFFGTTNATFELNMEHCNNNNTLCNHDDYCVDWRESEVRTWNSNRKESPKYFMYIVLVLFASVSFFTALILLSMYLEPKICFSELPLKVESKTNYAVRFIKSKQTIDE